ncbi:GntR family transcriptional regulator [Paracoccus mutanolyticus]|uniref:GntR family transcriptional regulator n=1 Tax=Paracoccus mutanolyticus TaxID=1499308 RepID=UPI001CB94755|nr:winged helix-turn-helix domain-containing protein [Paracoccus mutanolyticus]
MTLLARLLDTLPVADDLSAQRRPTLQGRLAAAIVRAILESRAPPGVRLPSSRGLADALGVSRMTVTLVYQELVSQGYLETAPRSGVMVAATVPTAGCGGGRGGARVGLGGLAGMSRSASG